VPAPADAFQVQYVANLNVGESYVNLVNAGTVNGFDPAGRICANIYAHTPDQQLVACCACPVTPNGVKTLSAKVDLFTNTLTPGVANEGVVKIIAATTCNPASVAPENMVSGLVAWRTTLHLNTTTGGYSLTENKFVNAWLSATELLKETTYCGFIQANGSGYGICRSCRLGTQGGAKM
jgi:hypothetical protein